MCPVTYQRRSWCECQRCEENREKWIEEESVSKWERERDKKWWLKEWLNWWLIFLFILFFITERCMCDGSLYECNLIDWLVDFFIAFCFVECFFCGIFIDIFDDIHFNIISHYLNASFVSVFFSFHECVYLLLERHLFLYI